MPGLMLAKAGPTAARNMERLVVLTSAIPVASSNGNFLDGSSLEAAEAASSMARARPLAYRSRIKPLVRCPLL